MIPLAEAFRLLDQSLAGWTLAGEELPLLAAVNRTLREDLCSRLELPPFAKSAMDGYAILPGDECEEYTVLETIPAGQLGREKLLPGTAIKIMTGAAVPAGTGKVVMVEKTRIEGGKVRILDHGGPANICAQGEDMAVGDRVLAAGATLTPQAIAGLLSCGITTAMVYRKIRVAVISTGDELVPTPATLVPGKIIDSNGPMLVALANQAGFEVVHKICLPDHREQTIKGIGEALAKADFLLLSGGVSAGDFDYVGIALDELGLTTHFSRVAIKPGKPMTYATGSEKAVFALPGNPVSVYTSFLLFVQRAAACLSGRVPPDPWRFKAPLAGDYSRKKAGRAQLVPCCFAPTGSLETFSYHGSGHLTALAGADGFFYIPADTTNMAAGSNVSFLPLPGVGR